LGRLFGCFEHLFDADNDGCHVAVRGDEQGPEVLVPAVDKQDNKQCCDVGARERDEDIPEEPQRACAVDTCAFKHFIGDGEKDLTKHEGCGG